ncbi:sugar ABC transporter permease [Effusibacillus lacus]|uniref:Sugar ABC transporter permease n=2 Tax=Effusibacillus lacus TaxID=1348429 RepID=A0A292YS34_9BACL|nr:carbohydrate ABC transporter membrane protein 2 (CUT1 family) [Effusibacillus lacus]GAX91739.1 sugar ABC transporter permease [Effusibacillus lacus]
MNRTNPAVKTLNYLILMGYAFLALYPVYLMIVSSLKENAEIYTKPLTLPEKFSLESYKAILNDTPFMEYLFNSVYISLVSVFFVLVFSSLAAYYIARTRFKWNPFLYFFFLSGLMIPLKLGILPMFLIYKQLGVLDHHMSLILTYVSSGMPFSVFVLVGFFKTLPTELEEAARIDGCSDLQVLYRILVPLMRPALATVAIMNFISIWNDFFYPLIFIKTEELKTLPLAMMSLFGQYETDWSVLFSGLTLSTLPMLLLFLIASKQFLEGMTAGAVKG